LNLLFLIYKSPHPSERVAELETVVKEVEKQLEDQEQEANNAITGWQESCAASDSKCAKLEKELETVLQEKYSLSKASATIEQDNDELEKEKFVLEERVSSLENSMKSLPRESVPNGKELELQNQVESLSEKLKEARLQASHAEEERQNMAKMWSTSEITIQMLQDDIASRDESIKRLNAEVEVAKSERDESIERLNAEIDIARSELENLRSTNANYIGIQADLVKSKAEVVTITDLLETERNSHLFEKEQLTGELYDEKARYTEARDEVANLTNEVEEIRSESEDVVNQWTGKFDPSSQVYSLLIIS
jgi:chromosome segregation ATPase